MSQLLEVGSMATHLIQRGFPRGPSGKEVTWEAWILWNATLKDYMQGETKTAKGVNTPIFKPTMETLKRQDGNLNSRNCPRKPLGDKGCLELVEILAVAKYPG